MIRYLADADFNYAIVKGCRRREPAMDFLSANEARLEGIPDSDVLALAAEQDRILITHDRQTMPQRCIPDERRGESRRVFGEPARANRRCDRCARAHLGGLGSGRMEEPRRKYSGDLAESFAI